MTGRALRSVVASGSMDTLARIAKLKEEIASTQREADKAQGVLERIHEQLREEFGCESVTDAERLLRKLARDERKAQARLRKRIAAFEEEWSDLL